MNTLSFGLDEPFEDAVRLSFVVDGKLFPEIDRSQPHSSFLGPGFPRGFLNSGGHLDETLRILDMYLGSSTEKKPDEFFQNLVPLLTECCFGDPYEGHLVCQIEFHEKHVIWKNFATGKIGFSADEKFEETEWRTISMPKKPLVFDRTQYEHAFRMLGDFLISNKTEETSIWYSTPKLFRRKRHINQGPTFESTRFSATDFVRFRDTRGFN